MPIVDKQVIFREVNRNNIRFFVNESHQTFWDDYEGRRDFNNPWEKFTINSMNRYLSYMKTFIDIGAWIGPTCLYGVQLARRCYAFEPDFIAITNLYRNLCLNPTLHNRLFIYNYAIFNIDGEVELNDYSIAGRGETFVKNGKGIKAIRLETFLKNMGIVDVNFIKCDVEGNEKEIITDCEKIINELKPTIHISLHNCLTTNDLEKIKNVLSKYKFIYNCEGETTFDYIFNCKNKNTEILVTDEKW